MGDPLTTTLLLDAAMIGLSMAMAPKIKGPRLDDLNVTLADYGTPIPRLWGTRRINPQIIWAEKLKEKKKKSKTKGAKSTEYKYYGTWAVLLCDHEIDAVTRIWFDKKLVYQTTGVGPLSPAAFFSSLRGGIKLGGNNMRVYLGTETQNQDPRIEQWCEDRYGPDSCPAYRGSAYIVFQDIPLETVGNRIPQITVEVVNNKSDAHPYETKSSDMTSLSTSTFFTQNGTWLAFYENGRNAIEWWDVPTRTKLGLSANCGFSTLTGSAVSLATSGVAYCVGTVGGTTVYQAQITPLGTPSLTAVVGSTTGFFFNVTRVLQANDRTTVLTGYDGTVGYIRDATHINHAQVACDFCVDTNGAWWGVFEPAGSSNQFTLQSIDDNISYTFTGLATRGSADLGAAVCHVAEHGHFFVKSDSNFYIIDDTTFTITSSGAFDGQVALPAQNPNASTAWDPIDFKEYSLADGSLIRDLTHTSWDSGYLLAQGIYEPVNQAIWATDHVAGHTLRIFYLDRVSSNGVTLATVVDDVSEWCGLTGQDTSALTQTVYGYSVTQGAGKDMLAPLLDIHDVDARPHDFSVQFKVRGSSPSGSIATSDFVAADDRYKVSIKQDTDLPKTITFNFADRDKDQQPNNVRTPRPVAATDSSRDETIDLTTYVDTPDSAQQKADRYQRRLWNSRERTSNALTAQHLALEPGDVTTISLDGKSRNVRLDKLTISQGQLNCEWVRDETSFAAVNSATTGPTMDGRDDETIFLPGPSKGFVIDGPLVEDVDNEANPIIYYAAGPYASGDFPGAVLAESDGIDYDNIVGGIDSSDAAVWGYATTVLATANANLWDRGNSVTIGTFSGTLTSHTEAEINADPTLNLAALGADGRWEYFNFATATLNADGTYTLSDLKRGRRGTEINTGNHAIGDNFVLLDNRAQIQRGTSDIGDALSFKINTLGRDIDEASAIDITYDAMCLKPYAPFSLAATKATDATITWIRRTRIGGAWNGTTIPVSEATESYEIDIYSGATFKRTLTATSPSKVYTAAQMATDGTGSGFTAKIYQMSATVGRGSEASATFSF